MTVIISASSTTPWTLELWERRLYGGEWYKTQCLNSQGCAQVEVDTFAFWGDGWEVQPRLVSAGDVTLEVEG